MKLQILLFLYIISAVALWSQNENISNGSVFDGEPYIAVNPNNSEHIVISWMGWAGISDRVKIKVRTSFDGGSTWGNVVEIPHIVNGYTSADTSIAFHPNGSVYISFIDSTGSGSNPIEGGIYITRSFDGGISFSTPAEVVNINVDPDRIPIDRPWLVIDNVSGTSEGTLYVTSMNVTGAIPDFHPYISISTDEGDTFEWKELDGPNWLSGNAITRPMPTPSIANNGTFYAIYPSFVLTQNLSPQFVLASSQNGGQHFSYQTAFESVVAGSNDPLAKTGYLLRTNPSNASHMVFVYLGTPNGDLDVLMRETFNQGVSWSEAIRVNDDPIGNDRMQDLVWADFDLLGNLIVTWRDRRNGSDNTYETASEIWASYREVGGSFSANFQITNETVVYDEILASAGNDFMGVELNNNLIHCAWGDPRNGTLSIWYQVLNTDGTILSIQEIATESIPKVQVYPNPANAFINMSGTEIREVFVYDMQGKLLMHKQNHANSKTLQLDIKSLKNGMYFLQFIKESEIVIEKFLKE